MKPLPALLLSLLAAFAAQAQDRVSLGKQRAAASALAWDIGEGAHPVLGPIRFAGLKNAVVTPVGDRTVYSLGFVSCERNTTTIAIELANATAKDDPNGLRPRSMPRLVCHRPGARPAQSDLQARWKVSALGDVLAQGLKPSQLRECASIDVVQEVILPPGWPRETARVQFEMTPYGRELDSIFYTCGEVSAYAPAPSPPVTVASAPRSPKSSPAPDNSWKIARTSPEGRTNLRAGPALSTAVVAQLPPDVSVLVKPARDDWWHVKSPGRAKFEGYIRADRLVFK